MLIASGVADRRVEALDALSHSTRASEPGDDGERIAVLHAGAWCVRAFVMLRGVGRLEDRQHDERVAEHGVQTRHVLAPRFVLGRGLGVEAVLDRVELLDARGDLLRDRAGLGGERRAIRARIAGGRDRDRARHAEVGALEQADRAPDRGRHRLARESQALQVGLHFSDGRASPGPPRACRSATSTPDG